MLKTQKELKTEVAKAAIDFIGSSEVIGVGTGSTVDIFIEELAKHKDKFDTTVASSIRTKEKLEQHGIHVTEFNQANRIDIYFDGADTCNPLKQLIKGGGGALTREKILADSSDKFICLIDQSKSEKYLGKFPVPIEVLPFARSHVAREIIKLNGTPTLRDKFVTDNNNEIIDVSNWVIEEPIKMEQQINNIPGVVCNGIFALNAADVVIISSNDGIKLL